MRTFHHDKWRESRAHRRRESVFRSGPGQMDEQCRPQHLRSCDDVPRRRGSGAKPRERNRKTAQQTTEQNRGVDVQVDRGVPPRPSVGGQDYRYPDGEQPLAEHQPGEHAIRTPQDRIAMLIEKLARTKRERVRCLAFVNHGVPLSAREQPNTGVPRALTAPPLTEARAIERPMLFPA
jgi:hypothetical protein